MSAEDLLQSLERDPQAPLLPVYLLVGEESFLVDEVVRCLHSRAMAGGIAGFNDDRFVAGEANAETVIAAAKTLPMMARVRWVLVRQVERWESKKPEDDTSSKRLPPLDALAAYTQDPSPSTVLVLCAAKLHGQRRVVTAAKKGGFLVSCDAISRYKLPVWVERRAKSLGHRISRHSAEHLVDLLGNELGGLSEALERLSLFVGPGKEIDDRAISTMIAPVREGSIWTLTDALMAQNLKRALLALSEIPMPNGSELMVIGAIFGSVRKLAKLDDALGRGESLDSAGREAGLPPFKLAESKDLLRRLPRGTLDRWLHLLAETDRDLKGKAKRPRRAVVFGVVTEMCR